MYIHRIINSVFNSNTFILDNGERGVYLVDIGDYEPVKEYLLINNKEPKGVFITHAHYDHIYGLLKLMADFPECRVYTSTAGIEGLASDKRNFSKYHGDPIRWTGNNIVELKEGSRVELWKHEELVAFATPGHDVSCLSYVVGNALFTGDSYIPNIKVVATFPRSNRVDAAHSLERLRTMGLSYDIYPGHGEVVWKSNNYV